MPGGGFMPRVVGIGNQDFEKIISRNIFYIDKTLFIKTWWENEDEVTLITRPRRFGKTLTMSMLDYFFSAEHGKNASLFSGLEVWKYEAYRQEQGCWPVIRLTFANIKETSYKMAKKSINRVLTDLYNKYHFLTKTDLLTDEEQDYFSRVNDGMDEVSAAAAIPKMSEFLWRYYGKKVILLLDEYDTPMQEAYVHGYWSELAGFIRSLFNAAFKTNPYLERALLTGITRVSKESVFSDLNNLEVITTTSQKYADAFGFTENEVALALKEYHLYDQMDRVKSWYDGFTFGRCKDIYNPWSIINFLDKGTVGTYWANTSSNGLVDKLIREGTAAVKEDFEVLLCDGTVTTAIDEQIVYEQLDNDEQAIWSLFLASGYLTISQYHAEQKGFEHWREIYELRLTNFEVRVMFQSMVRGWFSRAASNYNSFIRALLSDDVDAMNHYMSRVFVQTFSYFDTGSGHSVNEEPERFYHGFVLGLIVELQDRYVITSNRESGFGRYDVLLEPREPGLPGIILEFKVFASAKEKTLEDTVKTALLQIEQRHYKSALMARGLPPDRIRCYGFAFRGKEVLIGQGGDV